MVWDRCSIVLNTGLSGAFYTGDIVTGFINLEFKTNQKLEYIKCNVIGTSEAKWTRSMPTMPYLKIYSEKAIILDIRINLFQEYYGKTIEQGLKSCNFHFTLPEDLPSTFSSSIGKVKYYIEVKGKFAYTFMKKQRLSFIVIKRVNLNSIDSFKTPEYMEFSKLLWRSGKLSLCLKTFKGFAPKQIIPFEIVIDNENKTKISKIIISLIQQIEYTTSSGYANSEKSILKSECKKISNNAVEKCNFSMVIPDVVPSSNNDLKKAVKGAEVTGNTEHRIHCDECSKHSVSRGTCNVEVVFPFHFTLSEDVSVTVASDDVMHYDSEEINELKSFLFYYLLPFLTIPLLPYS